MRSCRHGPEQCRQSTSQTHACGRVDWHRGPREQGGGGRGGRTRDKRGDGDGQDGSRGLAWDLSCGGFQRRGALSGALGKGRGCGRPLAVQALVGWAGGWADRDIGLGRRAGRDGGVGGVRGARAEGGRGGHLAEVCTGGRGQRACIDGAWGVGGSFEGATWGRRGGDAGCWRGWAD